jgi:dethiobiotin synthetase
VSQLRGLFVSSTGTSEGKSVVACALAAALHRTGFRIAALKPMETGCLPTALDAKALARACQDPSLAERPGFFRAQLPAAPYAVELEAEQRAPTLAGLKLAVSEAARGHQGVLVEGAGGLFVPLSRDALIADLVHALELPVLLVASNRLGVLSHVLAAVEAAGHRGLRIAAVVLNENHTVASDDPSTRTNRFILAERLHCPVLEFPTVEPTDLEALAAAAAASGLLRLALRELEEAQQF